MKRGLFALLLLLAREASAQPIPDRVPRAGEPLDCSSSVVVNTGRYDTRVFWRVTKARGSFPDLCSVLERGAAGVTSVQSVHGYSSALEALAAGRTFAEDRVFEFPRPTRQAGDIWTAEYTPPKAAAELTACRFAYSKTFFVDPKPGQHTAISPATYVELTYVGTPAGDRPILSAKALFRARLGEVLAQCDMVPQ